MKMSAKNVFLKFIDAPSAKNFIKKNHYSGKVASTGLFYLGCFLGERLVGCIQYGRPIDKYKVLGLVKDTKWHDFLELNRLVFIDDTPKNIESRSLAMSFKLIKKNYPNIGWVLSFADACQCGSGTIYRAAGFHLTQINSNSSLIKFNDGKVLHQNVFTSGHYSSLRSEYLVSGYERWQDFARNKFGDFEKLKGYQIRYIKLLKNNLELNCESLDYRILDKMDFPEGVRHKRQEHEINAG